MADNQSLNGESYMTEGEYITAIQHRTNTFPTRECLNRGRKGGNIICRRCGLSVETLGHISGSCVEVNVVHKVKMQAEAKGFSALLESKIQVNERTLIPDLIIYFSTMVKAI